VRVLVGSLAQGGSSALPGRICSSSLHAAHRLRSRLLRLLHQLVRHTDLLRISRHTRMSVGCVSVSTARVIDVKKRSKNVKSVRNVTEK